MKNPLTLVALGLLSAVLALAPLIFAVAGIGLSLFAAAPLVHIAVTRDWKATLIAGAVGAGAALLAAGIGGAALVLALAVAPAVIVALTVGTRIEHEGQTYWLPLSAVILRLTLYVAVLVAVALIAGGYDATTIAGQLQGGLDEMLRQVRLQNPQFSPPAPEAVERQSRLFAGLIPLLLPVSLLFAIFISLRTGSRFARQRATLVRPPVDVPAEAGLPPSAAILFGLAAGLAGLGIADPVSQPFAGAFGFAFLCVGLAVVHQITRGMSGRRWTLVALYIAVVLPNLWLAIVVWSAIIALGLAETLVGVRKRVASTT